MNERKSLGDYVITGGINGKYFRAPQETTRIYEFGSLSTDGKSIIASEHRLRDAQTKGFPSSATKSFEYELARNIGFSISHAVREEYIEATEEEIRDIKAGRKLLPPIKT